jgi:1-carboxybiuret hydrolase subunit AtzG-like
VPNVAGRAMSAGARPPREEDRVAALNAAIDLLGLPVAEAWRSAALANMKVIGEAAQLVLDFPLADEDEPAPVFTP